MGDDGFQVVKRKKPTAVAKPPAPAEVKQERKTLQEIKISTNEGPRDLVKTENQPRHTVVINSELKKRTTDIKQGKSSYYCAFFPLKQGCHKGKLCPFLHDIPAVDKRDRAKIIRFDTPCVYQDKMGRCFEGDYCPFAHSVKAGFIDEMPAEPKVCKKKGSPASAYPPLGKVTSAYPPAGKVVTHPPSTTASTASCRTPSTAGSFSPLGPAPTTPQDAELTGSQRRPPPPEQPPLPPPDVPVAEPVAEPDEPPQDAVDNGLVEKLAHFTVDTNPLADGYLHAIAGDEVRVLYAEPGWYYGSSARGDGWFPVENVKIVGA